MSSFLGRFGKIVLLSFFLFSANLLKCDAEKLQVKYLKYCGYRRLLNGAGEAAAPPCSKVGGVQTV